jgi:hypothetical protein
VRTLVLLVAPLLLLSGCNSSSPTADSAVGDPEPVTSASADTRVLVAGTIDLALSGRYYSPDGFVPPLSLTVPAGWRSTHRGDDAFDLKLPDPAKDAPLVVIALITPKDHTVRTALDRLRTAAQGTVTAATGMLAGEPATGFEEVGGRGELVASPSGTLSLDALPSGHLLVLGTDIDQVPLLAVVLVPDGARWKALLPRAQQLLEGVGRG